MKIFIILLFALLWTGCSGSKDEVQSPAQPGVIPTLGGYGNVAQAQCVVGNCPKCTPIINSGSPLTASTGQPVSWSMTGSCASDSSRTYTVYHIASSPQPPSMQITGDRTSSVQITWTPQLTDQTAGSLTVTIRDNTACQVNAGPAGAAGCTNFSAGSTYDDTVNVSWQVSGSTQMPGAGQPGLPGQVGLPGQPGIGNVLLGAGVGALTGLLGNTSGTFDSNLLLLGALRGALGSFMGGSVGTQSILGGGYAQGVYGVSTYPGAYTGGNGLGTFSGIVQPTMGTLPPVTGGGTGALNLSVTGPAGQTTLAALARSYLIVELSDGSCPYCVELANSIERSAYKTLLDNAKCNYAVVTSDVQDWGNQISSLAFVKAHSYQGDYNTFYRNIKGTTVPGIPQVLAVDRNGTLIRDLDDSSMPSFTQQYCQ